jgi:pimeloyl-ACP methyl ester carboxylesterase
VRSSCLIGEGAFGQAAPASPFLSLRKRNIESTFLAAFEHRDTGAARVHSDLLSFDLAAEMRKRNRMANVFWFDNCGHVPPLMAPEQIDVVSRFLA